MSTKRLPEWARIVAARRKAENRIPLCVACGIRHEGAAWSAGTGWHDNRSQP